MENLSIMLKKNIAMDTFYSSVKVSTESVIKKVLSTNVKSNIVGLDNQNGVLMVSGKLILQTVYVGDNDEVYTAETAYDFVEKQKFDYVLTSLIGKDQVAVQDMNFANNEIVYTVIHNLQVAGNFAYEIPKEFENEELVTKKVDFVVNKAVATSNETFTVSEETLVSNKILKILNVSANVLLSDVSCTVDKVTLEGKIQTETLFLTEEGISTINKEFEFRQEVAAQGVVPNNYASADCDLKMATIVPEENNEKTKLSYTFEILANATAYEETTVNVCSDIFSLKNELTVAYDYIDDINYASFANFDDSVLSQTNISEIADFDDIVSVYNPSAKVLNIQDLGEKVVLNTEIVADAIYKTQNGYETLKVKTETKYELAKDAKLNVTEAVAVVTINSFKVKAGKELEVMFKLDYCVEYGKNCNAKFVKSIENIKEKSLENGGIKVYIARSGETLFDVARILNVTPETIASQNEVNDIFEQGEKIYVYSPINLV